jgi:predicted enzyme related to lactoylglutathione lyase
MSGQTFVTIYVNDMELSKSFYRDVLKWEIVNESNDWMEFKTGAATIVLRPDSGGLPGAGACRLSLWVDDLDSTFADLSSQSVPFVQSPVSAKHAKQATFCDPEGNLVDLIEPPVPLEPAAVTESTVVNEILSASPEAMQVLEEHGIRICGGCIVLLNGSVQETAEYSGLGPKETLQLIQELNEKVTAKGDL